MRTGRGRAWTTAGILALSLGAGVLLAYPSAASWFADVRHAAAVEAYTQITTGLTDRQRADLLDGAHAYNAQLTDSPLSDPFIPDTEGPAMQTDAGVQRYEQELSPSADAAMARLTIPAIAVDLPIYHGTGEESLSRGVGHLYGSSLPVGGSGTHAVLTAHNGFTGAQMFDELDRLRTGDEFTVTVAGDVLTYRVDRIDVVAPDEISALRQTPGRDYVTLVTCTPRYINSDRLLVRGERVASDADAAPAGEDVEPGGPWWLLLLAAPPAVASVLVVWSARRSRAR